jgi:Xaa-Pro aminopeptidase
LDVGAEYLGYSADISRTWSVGNATKRQVDVYQAVLELQDKAFNMLKPGVYVREYQELMEKEAISVVAKLGASFVGDKFPHGFSHFLGIDVHDAGDYEQPLQENSVITVEPGIYLPIEGIGVRIEDDVRITKNGIEILSKNIPRVL